MSITINHQTNDISATSGSLTIDGSVGIGATTVDSQLHVEKSDITAYNGSATDGQLTAGATAFVQQTGGSNNAISQIVFQPRNGFGYNRIVNSGGSAPYMVLATNNAERMRINSSGSVGIGKSNPATALDVDGTVTATAYAGDGSALTNVVGSTTAGAVGTYVWASPVSSNVASAQFVLGTTYAGTGLYPAGFATTSASTTTSGTTKYSSGSSIGVGDTASAALSGTWRAMGTTPPLSSAHDEMPTALFVRIS